MKSKKDSIIKCEHCGGTKFIPSHNNPKEVRCLNCGKYMIVEKKK